MSSVATLERTVSPDWHNMPRSDERLIDRKHRGEAWDSKALDRLSLDDLELPRDFLGPKQSNTPKRTSTESIGIIWDTVTTLDPEDAVEVAIIERAQQFRSLHPNASYPYKSQERAKPKASSRSVFSSIVSRVIKHPAGKHYMGHYVSSDEAYLRTTIQRRNEHYKSPRLQRLVPALSSIATRMGESAKTLKQQAGNILPRVEIRKSKAFKKIGFVALSGLTVASGAVLGTYASHLSPEKRAAPVAARAITPEHMTAPKVLANAVHAPQVQAVPQQIQIKSTPEEKSPIVINITITEKGQTVWGEAEKQVAQQVPASEVTMKTSQAVNSIKTKYEPVRGLPISKAFVGNSFSTVIS